MKFNTEVITEEDVDVDKLMDTLNLNNIILINDDHNTFDWVIACLQKYCKHSQEQAHQCALIVHTKGKCAVKNGSMEELKPIRDALTENGLKAVIE